MDTFGMIFLCIVAIATITTIHSIYLMVKLDKCERLLKTQRREQRAQSSKVRELNKKLESIKYELDDFLISPCSPFFEIKKMIND
jgi:hypothetical protein